jgi:cytochrome c oxidase subunit 3
MSFLDKVTAKPWEHSGELHGVHGHYAPNAPASRTGLYMFLAVVSSFFLLFSITYQTRATFQDWEAVREPAILWFNSGMLVLASIALHLATRAAKRDLASQLRLYLAAGTLLTVIFIAGQWLAWQQMLEAGLIARSNPANAFFYLFTGLHALHLLGGLWFLAVVLKQSFSAPQVTGLKLRVSLCATYWHYLLLVWAVLFYLLLNS